MVQPESLREGKTEKLADAVGAAGVPFLVLWVLATPEMDTQADHARAHEAEVVGAKGLFGGEF